VRVGGTNDDAEVGGLNATVILKIPLGFEENNQSIDRSHGSNLHGRHQRGRRTLRLPAAAWSVERTAGARAGEEEALDQR
jgi:hypothetical protein